MKKHLNQTGQILVLALTTVAVVLFSTLFIVAGSQLYFQNTSYTLQAEKATALAEAGIDKAVAALNNSGGTYNGETETFFGEGSYAVLVTSKDTVTKIVEATGYLPNKTNPKVKRVVRIEISKGVGVSFVYGLQIGEGGLELGNNNSVTGSVYSNGNVIAGSNNSVSGDVWVAGGPQGSPDQQTPDCDGANCSDYLFGKNINNENRYDIAQSFQPSQSGLLNKISLLVKKIGNPPDIDVRIMENDNGKPHKNNVLATGKLYSSLVTSSYGWIDVTFNTSPNLQVNTTYWIMVDTSTNTSNNYWAWQNDLAQGYTRGFPMWSPNWNTNSPEWNSINGELGFKSIMGGIATSVKSTGSFNIGGDVHANTIEGLTVSGDAYYQSITSSTAADYFPNSADPPPKVFPISDANVNEWKQQAEAAGVINANITTCVGTINSGKINGDIILENGCNITVKSPIWVTGNIILNNNNNFTLSSEYGAGSGVIIVDGIIEMNNNNKFLGTGTGSSLLMVLSAYDSRTNGISSIKINNNGNTGVFYASNGIIEPGNNNSFKELTAWKIKIVQNSIINYETGLSSTFFTSGPSGSYSLIKGTYQIK